MKKPGKLVVVAIGAIVLPLAACESATVNKTAQNEAISTEPSAAPSEVPSDVPSAGTAPAQLGDTIALHDEIQGIALEVTLTKVVDPAKPDNEYTTPAAGTRYVAAQFRIKNLGADTYQDSPSNAAVLLDISGQSFSATYGTVSGCKDFANGQVTLTADDVQIGCVIFEVDKNATTERVRFGAASGFSSSAEWLVGNG